MPELPGKELQEFYDRFKNYLQALGRNQLDLLPEPYEQYRAAKERLKLACLSVEPDFFRGEEEAEAQFMKEIEESHGNIPKEYELYKTMPKLRTKLKLRGTTKRNFSAFSRLQH